MYARSSTWLPMALLERMVLLLLLQLHRKWRSPVCIQPCQRPIPYSELGSSPPVDQRATHPSWRTPRQYGHALFQLSHRLGLVECVAPVDSELDHLDSSIEKRRRRWSLPPGSGAAVRPMQPAYISRPTNDGLLTANDVDDDDFTSESGWSSSFLSSALLSLLLLPRAVVVDGGVVVVVVVVNNSTPAPPPGPLLHQHHHHHHHYYCCYQRLPRVPLRDY
jgi:hypothetical protein